MYGDKLFAYSLSLCSDHEVSSEIVQQVFVNVFERKDKLSSKYSLKSYLYRSTFNKFIDLYRKKKSMTMLHEQYYLMLDQFAIRSDDNYLKDREIRPDDEKLITSLEFFKNRLVEKPNPKLTKLGKYLLKNKLAE